MGRQPSSAYMGRVEAARELEVSVRTLGHMVRRGLLVPHYFAKQQEMSFARADIDTLKVMNDQRSPDLHEVKALALMALSTARRAEARMHEVFERLGVDIEPLSREESAVRALYAEARAPLTPTEVRDPGFLRRWGQSLFGIDEVYLQLVTQLTGDDEPWKVFYDFTGHVTAAVLAEDETAVYEAYRIFQAGRTHLVHVSYVHCRRMNGQRVATQVFGGKASPIEELFDILH